MCSLFGVDNVAGGKLTYASPLVCVSSAVPM